MTMRRGPFLTSAASTLALARSLRTPAFAVPEYTRLDVYHVGDAMTTRTALTPRTLEAHPRTHHVRVSDSAIIGRTLRQVKTAAQHDGGAAPDVRWGLVFRDRSGVRRLAVYVDKFGKHGLVNDRSVTIAGGPLVSWLRAAFG